MSASTVTKTDFDQQLVSAFGIRPQPTDHRALAHDKSLGNNGVDGRISAWQSIVSLLNEIDPHWSLRGATGIQAALSSIYALKDAADGHR